ncbi:uncharacterized protein K452DRAFT_163465 [Aplosporella prunicola CBS 121167]|uniref:Uncharacterized protein n=1 Tax=Aplosporella prunicola CBS 121167 TaxID=1176127 RepID=A0A6A6BKE8_9PEZI|nr:uncharacterized protein K452DRAFT_163465 [Aplosporella prunicola CBS 121167]KAF2143863.1 hypothetical protein K452DRAFT_163465 [Aplosporella prunicola CBS 121167]
MQTQHSGKMAKILDNQHSPLYSVPIPSHQDRRRQLPKTMQTRNKHEVDSRHANQHERRRNRCCSQSMSFLVESNSCETSVSFSRTSLGRIRYIPEFLLYPLPTLTPSLILNRQHRHARPATPTNSGFISSDDSFPPAPRLPWNGPHISVLRR